MAYAITNNVIGKIEYRCYDLGTYHRDTPLNTAMPYNVANTYSIDARPRVRGGAVVARY